MIENDLDKVLNYMKRYVENVYEHDSEIMLNWKDIKLVLEEIERLYSIIKEVKEYIESYMPNYDFDKTHLIKLLEILQGSEKE